MPGRKRKDLLSHLADEEKGRVLAELLESHPELVEEANVIAEFVVDDLSADDIAMDVADRVTSLGLEDLGGRAGSHPWGYVEPSEAAWELLDEAIEDVRADMIRRYRAGMVDAAERVCQGIVLGLYEARNARDDDLLGWAPDFPAETAACAVSDLVEAFPPSRRKAAGRRILSSLESRVVEWFEMLERVVREATPRARKRR